MPRSLEVQWHIVLLLLSGPLIPVTSSLPSFLLVFVWITGMIDYVLIIIIYQCSFFNSQNRYKIFRYDGLLVHETSIKDELYHVCSSVFYITLKQRKRLVHTYITFK